MHQFDHFLVVVDEQYFDTKAIKRAIYFSQHTDARVSVVLIRHPLPVHNLTGLMRQRLCDDVVLSFERKLMFLEDYACQQQAQHPAMSLDLYAVNNIAELSILASQVSADALIISGSRHDFWQLFDSKPLDMVLIHESPYPVFVIKDHPWRDGGTILSAVEPVSYDDEHVALTETILQDAGCLSSAFSADTHLLDCYFEEMPSISLQLVDNGLDNRAIFKIGGKIKYDLEDVRRMEGESYVDVEL